MSAAARLRAGLWPAARLHSWIPPKPAAFLQQGFARGSPPFWTRKGLGVYWAVCSVVIFPAMPFLGRCLLNYTLYTALSTSVHRAHKHLCMWLFSKQNVISWDGIENIPLQVICQRISIFHAKKGCILIVVLMHSDHSHGKMEPNQYSKTLLLHFSNIFKYLFTIHFDHFPSSFKSIQILSGK